MATACSHRPRVGYFRLGADGMEWHARRVGDEGGGEGDGLGREWSMEKPSGACVCCGCDCCWKGK